MRTALAALLALIVLVVADRPTAAQTKPPLPIDDLAGEWRGQWISPSGYLFTTTLTLKVAPDGAAEGRFLWVLRRSPLPEEQRKLGMEATEFVSGRVDATARTASLAGTRKDDPNDVIFMDLYRLVVSDNGRTMGGLTRNLGDWDGQIFLQR